jgi:putative ABC transport system ATP-binding protein
MIELRGIHKSYLLGEVPIPVLKGVSLRIERGEFVAIMGPSGSGKSTFLNIIGCLDCLDSGSYELAQTSVVGASEDALTDLRSRHLGFVFQMFNLIPRFSALRNVELPLIYSVQSLSAQQRKQRALEMLVAVGLADRADHAPSQLSGGQQQRVAIARALVNGPSVLIADEPTGSLDSQASEGIMKLFVELNRSGITIVMVTHEEGVAACASRVVRMRDGMIETDVRQ